MIHFPLFIFLRLCLIAVHFQISHYVGFICWIVCVKDSHSYRTVNVNFTFTVSKIAYRI